MGAPSKAAACLCEVGQAFDLTARVSAFFCLSLTVTLHEACSRVAGKAES